ncbi:hypothetical protein ACTXT7_009511 [Hymenolepis weldensis]
MGNNQAENNLPVSVFCSTDIDLQVINIVDKATEDNSHDTLKSVVISRLSDSRKKSVQQRFLGVELGDCIPSASSPHAISSRRNQTG